MTGDYLAVTARRLGRVCVLAVSGELDAITADGFPGRVRNMVDDQAESLIVDLSGLEFIDCGGARALAEVICASPAGRPVAVHSASAPVRRVFGLLGLDIRLLPCRTDGLSARPLQELVLQARATQSWARNLRAQSREVAGLMAVTEDELALTLTWLAEQRPDAAGRLTALSQAARRQAADYRQRAVAPRQLVA